MKRLKSHYHLLVLFLIISINATQAQVGGDRIPKKSEVDAMIDSIEILIGAHYIQKEMGVKIGAFIQKEIETGKYYNVSLDSLGRLLKRDFVKVSDDVHMGAWYSERKETQQENALDAKLHRFGERSNFGHSETKISKENIGYLKVTNFTQFRFFEQAKKAVDRSMISLQNSDAIIVDVRGNPGGFEDIVAYLVSYFVDGEKQELQKYYCRFEDRSRSVYTTVDLPGRKIPDVPVFILVDYNTGSAAESFAYIMKHLDRATIIGDTTVGAGNGSTYLRITNEFMIQVANWETINAVTQKSWEKNGVIPNIVMTSDKAPKKAYALAKIAALEYRKNKISRYEGLLANVEQALNQDKSKFSSEAVTRNLLMCLENGLYTESEINQLGYDYMHLNSVLAEAILATNVIAFPLSPNVYDSYGESLAANGKHTLALENFKKALHLADKDDPNYQYFSDNVKKLKSKVGVR